MGSTEGIGEGELMAKCDGDALSLPGRPVTGDRSLYEDSSSRYATPIKNPRLERLVTSISTRGRWEAANNAGLCF